MNVDADLDRAALLAERAAGSGATVGLPDLEAVGLALEGITHVRRGRDRGRHAPARRGVGDRARRGPAAADLQGLGALLPDLGLRGRRRLPARDAVVRGGADARGRLGRAPARRHLPQRLRERPGHQRRLGHGGARAHGAVGDLRRSRPAMDVGRARPARRAARPPGQDRRGARAVHAGRARTSAAIVGLGATRAGGRRRRGGGRRRRARAAARPAGARLDHLPALELLVRARAALGEHDEAADALAELDRIAAESARRTCSAGRGARQARWPRRAASTSRRGARSRTPSTCWPSRPPPTRRRWPGSSWPARWRRSAATRPPPPRRRRGGRRSSGSACACRRPSGAASNELTPRELEILRLVAQGLNDAEIAERLVLSQHTVHRHVANVRTKLRLPSRTAAVAYAARAGLL